ATAALTRRFGSVIAESTEAVNQLIQQVSYSVTEARNIPFQRFPNPVNYGLNPSLTEEYQYIVVGTLPNPLNPDQNVSVPWTINSPTPLSNQQILEQAEKELNEGFVRPDRYMAAEYADLHRRDLAFQRLVQDQYGGEAPIDIQIIGAYKRA
ncbi:MAG TPA: hypothetical protein VH593_18695, partial [Ktedonobacteraceae bacterium]